MYRQTNVLFSVACVVKYKISIEPVRFRFFFEHRRYSRNTRIFVSCTAVYNFSCSTVPGINYLINFVRLRYFQDATSNYDYQYNRSI